MKKIVVLSILFSIISLVFFTSCKKNIIEPTETEIKIVNPSVSIKMIDGTHALVTAECQSIGGIEGIEVNLRGALTQKMTLKKSGENNWSDTLELSNNGTDGYIHGYFKPIYGGITHTDEGINTVTSDDPYLKWEVETEIQLGDAIHVPTTTGGTSTVEISNVKNITLISVVATKISDNTLLGEYAINVPASAETFDVIVDYIDHPIFNTPINLRVSVEDRVKNYQYTTLTEENCGLTFEGNYVSGESTVSITISGNDRSSSFEFKAFDGSTLLNTYGGTMAGDKESKTFSFPIESENDLLVNFVVTSEQHPLCVYDEFSYMTPNRITNISISGTIPGSLRPSGGTIFGSYNNDNFPSGETSILNVQTPSEGVYLVDPTTGALSKSINIDLNGEMGTITYDFETNKDENNAVFIYSCEHFEIQPANTTVTTLTQTYNLIENADIVQIDSLQVNTTQFMSADLSTNYTGTKSKKITLKIKNTLTNYNPWEYLSLLVINGINVPVSNASDWGDSDTEGFYTFTIDITDDINISNIDFVTVDYRSKSFITGKGDSFDIKISVEIDFIDKSVGSNFIVKTTTKNIIIE